MSQQKPIAPPPSLSLQDVLYVLFKHKWKIAVCALLGIGAAAAVYLLSRPVYESQAKLLVRYVIDTSAIDHVDSRSATGTASENLINSEVEILTSWDLSTEVAKAVGIDRLLLSPVGIDRLLSRPTAGWDLANAARSIRMGISVSSLRGTNIIAVSYKNPDPELATLVLSELVTRYFTKHLEVHRSADAFNFVSQRSDQVRARLNQTEEDLKRLKDEVGIISLTETTALINTELANTQNTLQTAKADYAEQSARVEEIEKSVEAQEKDALAKESVGIDNEVAQRYQTLIAQLDGVRRAGKEVLAKYSEKAAKPELPDESQRARLARNLYENAKRASGSEAIELMNQARRLLEDLNLRPEPSVRFKGAERDTALALARERYRQQNNTGFAYRGNKKDFDTLVKEAQDEILGKKKTSNLQSEKLSQLELAKVNQMQVDNLEQQLRDLEKRYPELLAASAATAAPQQSRLTLQSERARLAGIEARTEVLKARLQELQKRAGQLSDVGPQIEQLERMREIEETNYKYFQASLEKARIDEALDPSKMPNISVVQSPSVAFKASRDTKKVVLGLAAGGVGLGLAFAFLMELVVNQSVKRPRELEALLGVPLLVSIPYLNGRNRLRLLWPGASRGSTLARRNGDPFLVLPWESEHFIRPYSEAIRDRLVLYFELNNMVHKPKLVGVADSSAGAGASTVAAGIAAALSEVGDGKVLLVDMNVGRPEIHPFFRGGPACSLVEALVGAPAPANDNLYLALANVPDAPQGPLIPKKFYELVPHLKASDFDYIIFDLPPLGQTSTTLPMSRFMDKILVVVEAEKSNRDFLKRAYSELVGCRANVSLILNKTRSYLPKWIGAEG